MQQEYDTDNVVVVDGGASGGLHRRWKAFLPNLKAILFEPDGLAYQRLQSCGDQNIQVEQLALSDRVGDAKMFVCRKRDLSSVFRPNQDVVNLYPNRERYDIIDNWPMTRTTSLDHFFKDWGHGGPHFIKLDTQGSELAILEGGGRVLPRVIGLEIEVWYLPVYENVPLYPEIDALVQSFDFRMYDLANYYWQQQVDGIGFDASLGDLVSAEVLYFKPPALVLELACDGILSLHHAVECYLAYGYTHLSEVLVDMAVTKGYLDPDQQRSLSNRIQEFQKPRGLSSLPGADIVRWRLGQITERLLPWSGWASKSKPELGSRHI